MPVTTVAGCGVTSDRNQAPYQLVFDLVAGDNTILASPTVASRENIYVLSMTFSESTAANITIKAGATNLVYLETVANQGTFSKFDGGVICAIPNGSDLVINSSAIVTSVHMWVATGKNFLVRS